MPALGMGRTRSIASNCGSAAHCASGSNILPVPCSQRPGTHTSMVDVSPSRSANEPLFTVSHAEIDSSTCTTLLEYLQRAAIGAICSSLDHGSFKKDGNDSWWSCDFESACSLAELCEMLFGLIERRGSNQTLNSHEILMRREPIVKTEGGDDDDLFETEEVQESPDKAYLDTTGNSSNGSDQVRSTQLAHRLVPLRT